MRPVEQSVVVRTSEIWRSLASRCTIEAFMKWFYASSFSYITHQEFPPFPGDLQGRTVDKCFRLAFGASTVSRFYRSLLSRSRNNLDQCAPGSTHACTKASRAQRRAALMVASTIANMKKGSPCPTEEMVLKTQERHSVGLRDRVKGIRQYSWLEHSARIDLDKLWVDAQLKDALPFPTNRDRQLLRSAIKRYENALVLDQMDIPEVDDSRLARSVREVCRQVFSKREFREGSAFPSISGHFDSSRRLSGAAKVLQGFLPVVVDNDLVSMHYHPHCGVVVRRGNVVEVLASEFFKRKRSFDCKPSFILEPLKVRAVTAGPSLEYYSVMPLQKFLWRTLKEHPTFELIGTPVTAEILSRVLLGNKYTDQRPTAFLSGDYSAATDNLRSFLSRTAFDEICTLLRVPSWMRRVGSKALVGHRIHYQLGGMKGQVVDQWNGQLMGSPLSFPILCIVNAAICKLSFEMDDMNLMQESKYGARLSSLPLLVNGDDCVMTYTLGQKQAWERVAALAGMEPSVGKCYWSSRFLQINSENFILERDDEGRYQFESVPYHNFSLCSAQKAKGGEDRHWSDLGSSARHFIKGFDPKEQDRMISVFIRRQRPLLNKAPDKISWFLPECLGGLGIPWLRDPAELERETTYRQRLLATYLRGRIEAGESPLRRGMSAQIPIWVQRGMREAARWEIPLKGSLEEISVLRCAKADTSGMEPWMWRSLRNAEGKDFEVQAAEDTATIKGWFRAWEQSLKLCNFARSAAELVAYLPPKFILPGGLSATLSKASNDHPRHLVSGFSAQDLVRKISKPVSTGSPSR